MTSHLLLNVNKASKADLHPENPVQGADQDFRAQHVRQGRCC